MSNRDLAATWRYHDGTKHSVARLRANRHSLDWHNKPLPFKIYEGIDPIPLPRGLTPSDVAALAAIGRAPLPSTGVHSAPDLAGLARVLHLSAGVTRKKVYPGGQEYYFRAAACTGALYHIDVYVVCGDLPGLSAGVYQFGAHDFALYRLRAGDFRGSLVEASGAEPSVEHAPVILAYASTYWRNAWKYQARAYRHCFWDTGTILANLLSVTAGDGLQARVVCGFVDEAVRALLGLDREREGALALVPLGYLPDAAPAPATAPPALNVRTAPLSPREVDYPAIREMHDASSLTTPEEVRNWRASALPERGDSRVSGQRFPLRPLDAATWPPDTIDQVIPRRGSTRQFAQVPLTFVQLSTILQSAVPRLSTDFGASPNDLYLIVNAVDDLPSGTYVYHRGAGALELLRAGTFRREAGYLGLGQKLPADASVNIYLLSDLQPALERLGNRGYRAAQLDAAITGGKMYLAAYALRLGATGLTFFDDDVTEFFSPHAAGKSVMFLVALGRGRRALATLR